MIRTSAIGLLAFLSIAILSCEKPPVTLPADGNPQEEESPDYQDDETMPESIAITISAQSLPVILEENEAAKALVSALREAPITYEAHDYGGFEKVGPLGRSLPSDDTQITTVAGDVILYGGNQIVLFYGSNSWSYTRLGRIQFGSLNELKGFLKAGEGSVSVTLSL